MESNEFQRLTSKRMFFHSMDDKTIQFEMVMVITDMRKPRVGAMARLMLVIRYCNVKPTLSWRVTQYSHPLKPRLIVDADSVSDESAC